VLESTVILDGVSLYVPVDPLLEVEVQAKVKNLNLSYRSGILLIVLLLSFCHSLDNLLNHFNFSLSFVLFPLS
jgi:hypothetical protein